MLNLKIVSFLSKLKYCYAFSFLLVSNIIFSQIDLPSKGISLSYYNSMLVHPGLRIGYEIPIWQKIKEKENHKTKFRALIFKSNLGFYNHARNNTGLFVNAHIGYRLTSNSGLYAELLHIGIGYLQTFLGGKTYSIDQSNAVTEIKMASNSNIMLPYISIIGLGYDFRKKHKKPISMFVSFDTFIQRTVNTKSLLRLSAPIGFTYYFK